MNQTMKDLKIEIEKSIELMRTLRDEVRVKVHLAGMDVKDEWKKLEPKIEEVEKAAGEFTDATRAAASDTVKRLNKLRASLS